MTLKDTHNATSSRESGCGQLHLDLQDAMTTNPCGLEAAPANHSAVQESKKANQTSGICGQCGSSLSVNPNRLLCLESKCQQLLVTVGGMTWPMIWKEKVTPRGRKLGQLVVLVDRTNATDCGLWPTPSARDYKDTGDMSQSMVRKDGKPRMDTLGRLTYNGFNAQMGNHGQLNPQFPCWLMGISTEHLSSMQLAMESYQPVRKNSSRARKE